MSRGSERRQRRFNPLSGKARRVGGSLLSAIKKLALDFACSAKWDQAEWFIGDVIADRTPCVESIDFSVKFEGQRIKGLLVTQANPKGVTFTLALIR